MDNEQLILTILERLEGKFDKLAAKIDKLEAWQSDFETKKTLKVVSQSLVTLQRLVAENTLDISDLELAANL